MPLCLRPYLSVSLSHVSPSQSLSPSLLSCLSLTPPSRSRLFLARYPLNLYLSPFTASLSLSPSPLLSPIPLPPLSPLSRSVSHSLPLSVSFTAVLPVPFSVPPSLSLSHYVSSCYSLCLAQRAKTLKNHKAGRRQNKGRTKEGSQVGEWGSLPSPSLRRAIPV